MTSIETIASLGSRAHTVQPLRWLHEPDLSNPVAFLDRTAHALSNGEDVHGTMDLLSDGLWWLRKHLTSDSWAGFCTVAAGHPLKGLVHQDPFTHRSFCKPRGYAGDASLVDMMYYDMGVADLGTPTELGAAIFARNKDTPAPSAVRHRRDHMARLIDEVSGERASARILAAACGHLREAELSAAVRCGSLGRFVALDQDVESLRTVKASYGQYRIETEAKKIRALIGNVYSAESFDLIYATGLYDYLTDQFAQRLTTALFGLLSQGGRLVIGNFVPDIYDVGYMECYMGWHLAYRTATDMMRLTSSLPVQDLSTVKTYTLADRDIVYLEIRKRRGRSVTVPRRDAA